MGSSLASIAERPRALLVSPASDATAVFSALGDHILAQWHAAGYAEDAFSSIATAALAQEALHEHVALESVLTWQLDQPRLPAPSSRSPFGQPPITVYWSDRFYIQVIVWLDSTTAIHQHGFSGAFQVLHGSSVHTVYDWQTDRQINERLGFGTLSARNTEALRAGYTRAIEPGDALIHSLFHLEHPSATVVVRTNGERRFSPQFLYHPRHLRIAPSAGALVDKKVAALRALHALSPAQATEQLRRRLGTADPEFGYHLLRTALSLLGAPQAEREVLGAAQERFGDDAALMWSVLREQERRTIIERMRARVSEPAHRLLLAAVLVAHDQRHVFEIVRAVEGSQPRAKILEWVRGLAGSRANTGGFGLDFGEPELLVLEVLMGGGALPQVQQRLRAEHPAAEVDAATDHLAKLCHLLRRSPIFGPLLTVPWAETP